MLYLGTDHRGLKLKNQLKTWLTHKKIQFKDLGAYTLDPQDDFPDYTKLVAEKVLEDPENNKGILLCGSGAGVCIAANKFPGVRCSLGLDSRQVKSFAQHDSVNILSIASDHTSKFKTFQLVKTFLNTKFEGAQRQLRRLKKIKAIEEKYSA